MKKFWEYINGRKTTIACVYWSFMVPALAIIYPTGIPSNINKANLIIGLALSALGLGHKVVKNFAGGDESAS
jgi:hypothetical protein